MSLGSGVLGSAAADGAVSLWTIAEETPAKDQAKKRSRKLILDTPSVTGLRRVDAEGTGTPVAVCVEDAVGGDVAYVTDTGVLVLSARSDWV